MDAQWVLVICVIALLLGLYRMSRRIDQKIAQALEQKPTNQVIPAASKAELGDDSFWKWFQSSKVASIVVRRQVILSVNPAAEQLLGRSLSDLKDRPASAFMTQSSAAFAQKVGIEPELSEREYEIVKPDGEVITIVTQPSMLSLGDENTRVLMIFDVTEQRRREAILRDSEKTLESELSQKSVSLGEAQTYLNLALEHFSEGYILVDPSQMIRFLNRRVRAIFPEVAQMLRPQMDWIRVIDAMLDQGLILAPSDADKAIVKTWFEQGSLAGFTQQDLELNGHRWVRVTIKSLPAGDQIITVVDISELKAAIENAEIAASSKSNFLASMSHEIRTPMNGILGMVDLMKRSPLSEDQKEMVATIQDSGKALLSLINDILDISKIEAGRIELESLPSDLAEVSESALEVISANAAKHQQSLILIQDSALPSNLLLDGLRLRQILVNLVGNAIKFSPLAAEIVVRIEKLERQVGDYCDVLIRVIDQGIGLSAEAQANIFADFAQAEKSTSRIYGGTGLGLAICRRLVEVMQGRIEVISQLGQGAEFQIQLRLLESPDVAPERGAVDLSGVDIFYVSASERSFESISGVLTPLGANCHAVVDPMNLERSLALDAISTRPVVILSDRFSRPEQEAIYRRVEANPLPQKVGWVFFSAGRGQRLRLVNERLALISSNPFRRRELMSAAARVVGRDGLVTETEMAEVLQNAWVPMTAAEAAQEGLLILVAEDNAVNQQVIRRQLNTLGLACELVDDGVAALDRIRLGGIGLLLTDCDMPNMDGYELTRRIRQEEVSLDNPLPIIAITANAMDGAAAACFEAGMNDYLSKPLEIGALQAMLRTYLPSADQDQDATTDAQQETDQSIANASEVHAETDLVSAGSIILDLSELNALFGDDVEVLNQLLAEFVSSLDEGVAGMLSGFDIEDYDRIRAEAHKLKSSARTVGAHSLADLCFELELAGKAKAAPALQTHLGSLQSICDQTKNAIAQAIVT
ncbi:MAG: response regulator [Gammaproteobacteria bacterium]|nr:response regulator [Gammaproteobacteria bacterium]